MKLTTLMNWTLIIALASLAHVALYRSLRHVERSFRQWGIGWFVAAACVTFFLFPVRQELYFVPQAALFLASGLLFLDGSRQVEGKRLQFLPMVFTLAAWLSTALLIKLSESILWALVPVTAMGAYLYLQGRKTKPQQSHFGVHNLYWLHRFQVAWVLFIVLLPTLFIVYSLERIKDAKLPAVVAGILLAVVLVLIHHVFYQWMQNRKEKDHSFKLFIQHSPDIFYHIAFKPTLKIRFLSPVVEQLVGISRDVFYQHPRLLFHLIHPEDRPLLQHFRELDSPSNPLVLRWRDRNGDQLWTESYNRLERNSSGEITGCEGMMRNITYELDVKRELQAALDGQQQMLEEFPAMIWRSDPDCGRVYLNQQWLDFRGRSIAEEVGFGWEEGIHPDDLELKRKLCRQAHDNHQPFEMEYRLRRHDGQYRTLLERGVPKVNEHGTFAGFTGFCFDITDRKIMEEQLLQANRMEAVSRISRNIAHEFNNLLAVVSGNADLLSLKVPGATDLNLHLDQIKQACAGARTLTRQLQSISGSSKSHPYLFDLNDLIEDLLPMLRRIAGTDVEIIISPAEGRPIIEADGRQIEMVLLNLVTNARDALPDGGLIRIEIERVEPTLPAGEAAGAREPRIQVQVTDTGTGMSPETVRHAFEPFYTTKDADKGTGLGLPTSRNLIKQNGGTLRLHTKEGVGTTVILEFPLGVLRASAAGSGQDKLYPSSSSVDMTSPAMN